MFHLYVSFFLNNVRRETGFGSYIEHTMSAVTYSVPPEIPL